MILRLRYLTRVNRQKIMAVFEQEHVELWEDMNQVKGKVNMIFKAL